MVLTTCYIPEGILKLYVSNDSNLLGDNICNIIYFDHTWTAGGALKFLLHKECVSQVHFLLGQGCLKQNPSEKTGNLALVWMN